MTNDGADDGHDDVDTDDADPEWKTVEQLSANREGTGQTGTADDEQRPETDIERRAYDDERSAPDDRGQHVQQNHGRLRACRPTVTHPPLSSSRELDVYLPMTMHDLVHTYAPLLCCPACSPPSRLVAPTTLHCGHTVCAKHVRTEVSAVSSSSASASRSTPTGFSPAPEAPAHQHSSRAHAVAAVNNPPPIPIVPTCPLPTCQPRARQQVITPNIPLESTVAYYPPIAQSTAPGIAEPHHVTVPEPRLDVSLGRVLHLLETAKSWEEGRKAEQRNADKSDGTDDETEVEEQDRSDDVVARGPQVSTSTCRHNRRRSRPTSSVRKRSRKDEHSDGSHHRHPAREELEERFNKELTEMLTCEICFMLLLQPVTTPCQHTFCAKCLQRSLDHGSKCPLCRQDLPPFSYFQDHPFNKAILAILLKAFPEGYTERGRAIEEEERDGRLNTPIFVCQLAFPGIPTLLHFYEPRYRLMLRRCLESPAPCFGMIMPQRTVGTGSSDYGTMLEIRSVQMLPDGRSMVETIGTHRFRIMETGTLDGYMVGRIERVDDIPSELEDEAERGIASLPANQINNTDQNSSSTSPSQMAPPTTEELIAICHAFVDQLRNGTAPWVVQRLNNTYGPMPNDVSSFSFWMAQVLPIEEHEKAKLLVIRSARARLRLVVYWIEQLNSNWWFSRGCTIS